MAGLKFCHVVQTFSKRQILHCSQLKEFADNSLKFDENNGMWEKEKLLIMCIFSFSQDVLKTCTADL